MAATQTIPPVYGFRSLVSDGELWGHLDTLSSAGLPDPCALLVRDLASEGRIRLAAQCEELLPSPAEEARGAMQVGFASRAVVCDILRRHGHDVAARELARDHALKVVILDAETVELRKPPAPECTPVRLHT